MTIKTWVHWYSEHQKDIATKVTDILVQQGIEVQGLDAQQFCNQGVIFDSEISPELCQQLKTFSNFGRNQILVCCSSPMSGGLAWRLMESGASDVLTCKECKVVANEISARLLRWKEVDQLMDSPPVNEIVIGDSLALKTILRQVVEVGYFTDASVLVLGESGTGKELIAKIIHALDPRKEKGNLIILDCSTLTPELSGSEFFGHERGAFTGATSSRDGAFALADRGTLFLDEVGELPMYLQTQLLRVIQEHTYKRVGSNAWQSSSFRLICATNRDLLELVQRGEFRADLYYRIAGFICQLPPLRERTEDILPLANHFLKLGRTERDHIEMDETVKEYLLGRKYPGNVRDLKQVVARMLCRYAGKGALTVGCIPAEDRPCSSENNSDWRDTGFERAIRIALANGAGLKMISREAEETAIRLAVEETGGNLQRAATRLGVTDRALQMRRAAQRQENKLSILQS